MATSAKDAEKTALLEIAAAWETLAGNARHGLAEGKIGNNGPGWKKK